MEIELGAVRIHDVELCGWQLVEGGHLQVLMVQEDAAGKRSTGRLLFDFADEAVLKSALYNH